MQERAFLSRPTFLVAAALIGLWILSPGLAHAQLSKDDQKCVNEVNKDLEKVSKGKAKDIESCQKGWSKGDSVAATPLVATSVVPSPATVTITFPVAREAALRGRGVFVSIGCSGLCRGLLPAKTVPGSEIPAGPKRATVVNATRSLWLAFVMGSNLRN